MSRLVVSAYLMIQRRAVAAGIATKIGNYILQGAGMTAYLNDRDTLGH